MNEKTLVAQALEKVLGEHLTLEEITNSIERPKVSEHGDLAFPAFPLAKIMRKAPQMIAQDIADQIEASDAYQVQPIGPYVNFFLNKAEISQATLTEIIEKQSHYGDQTIGENRMIPIDLSSPNIAKPMSMGHLRSTVIGNSIALLVEKLGYQPYKINYLGDWGTQFGKLIVGYKKWGSEQAVIENPIKELLRLYVEFHEKAETDPSLEDEGRAWFKKLEDGDEEALHLWKWFREESLKEFQRVYDLLEVTFDSYNGESFYNDKMNKPIELLEEKNLLISDQGADIVDLSKYDLNPALIRKSDGATLYITRDLASALYRKEEYNFDKAVYVVGNEQSIHFKQLKAVLKELGFNWADDIVHVPFGLITKDGKKLSTRKGKIVLLEEVLSEAINLSLGQIEDKNPSLENKEETARQVGVGAVIFHDLKNDRLNNFDFNLEEVVRFEGETGPYVQYTHARSASILRKTNWQPVEGQSYELNDAESWEVIKLLKDFPSVIERAAAKYEPSVIAKYVIDLAQTFNKYYAHTKIVSDDDQQDARLALVYSVKTVLKEGLRLLGVHAPEEM
ncbi:arginine--tRNA ligase [Vagococcus xieshaowenii]|uniref:Arginine--tRNA ligase n=1 Tax=Vagococcus xieshaowenii TaxID=2562451 RepID=A0AAJ5EE53_9ENTE|nr:arginine--tRNA ligase [Vagococcus xieshaowenii]QCA29049.1 arginine--tRNA ligase [Vagococcus xieshaowenii]TFZ40975.1 arginine--tRNA ligase [Vagococcus xieshaowenii]